MYAVLWAKPSKSIGLLYQVLSMSECKFGHSRHVVVVYIMNGYEHFWTYYCWNPSSEIDWHVVEGKGRDGFCRCGGRCLANTILLNAGGGSSRGALSEMWGDFFG